jgi:hypothetical protein
MQERGLSSTTSVRTRIKSTRHQGCRNSILFRTGNLRSEISLLTPCRRENFAIFEGASRHEFRNETNGASSMCHFKMDCGRICNRKDLIVVKLPRR